jgi:hypothetical protein
METLLDIVVALIALLSAMLLAYGAWLCMSPFQRRRSADGAPISLRKRMRSVSERFSASSR